MSRMERRDTWFIVDAIESLKQRLRIPSDAELSEYLCVSKQMLSKVRNGDCKAPANMLFKLLDNAEYAVTREAVLTLLPKDTAKVIRDHDISRLAKRRALLSDPRLEDLLFNMSAALDFYSADDLKDVLEEYLETGRSVDDSCV